MPLILRRRDTGMNGRQMLGSFIDRLLPAFVHLTLPLRNSGREDYSEQALRRCITTLSIKKILFSLLDISMRS